MDDAIKMAYEHLFGINVDNCKEVNGDYSKLEIDLDGNKQKLIDFLQSNTRVISIDHFSTKEVTEKLPKELEMFKQKYMEMTRFWGLTKYHDKPIGIVDRLQVYNGFPTVINSEDFANNPQEVFLKGLDVLVKKSSLVDMIIPPMNYCRTKAHVISDFYDRITEVK